MTRGRDPLLATILEEIDASGPIGLDRYMAICLGDPESGYYAAGAPIGAEGDFTTAPEISQIFGELAGLWLAQCWIDQGRPDPFALVELGPGRGVLMADALRAARVAPGFLQAARLRLVETSAPLREEQRARLGADALASPPRWVDRLEQVERLPLLLVANEFFDALPIRQWIRRGGAWRERLVGREGDGLGFVAADAAGPGDAPDAPEGAVREVSAASRAVAAEIGARLAREGGAALVVDYGYTDAERERAGWRETLQALRSRRFADPLEAPGAADLTAHVAFDDLARAASGAAAHGPIGQGVFLLRLGAAARAAALAKASPERAPEIAAALHRLTEPDAMGLLFRALALTPAGAPSPPGFDKSIKQP